jgi:dynamin family protein
LAGLLGRARCCIQDLWPDGSRYGTALAALRERLVEQRLQVAVLGQFKRGKSTFLNALLGESLLPTGVVPLTAIATFIHWAATPSIRVSYLDERAPEERSTASAGEVEAQLSRFVTEEWNPHNRLRVGRVDVFYPAPILRHGIVLIDTPGVGSTLRHNTDAALEVLPECDAGFFVLSVDPPVTEAELAYLECVRPAWARPPGEHQHGPGNTNKRGITTPSMTYIGSSAPRTRPMIAGSKYIVAYIQDPDGRQPELAEWHPEG